MTWDAMLNDEENRRMTAWEAMLDFEVRQDLACDYRAVVVGDRVGTPIQGIYTGSVTLFADTAEQMDQLLEELDYEGHWRATAYRRWLDPTKPAGSRFVREEFYQGVGHGERA